MRIGPVSPFGITKHLEQSSVRMATKRSRTFSIVREFALNTSTHALPAIARSESKINRLFWSVSFIVFSGVMAYFITQSIINYFQYPAQTSVSVVVDRSQPFPALTFCNAKFTRWDTIFPEFLNYTASRGITNITNTTLLNARHMELLFNLFADKVNADENFLHYFFPLEIMLISCTFNGVSCDKNDFISFLSPNYGRCYTYNAKRKHQHKQVMNVNRGGSSGILKLELYAHRQLNVPAPRPDVSVAMVMMVHDNRELPMIDTAGLLLSSGKRHRLSFKKKATYFLPSPYTDCTTDIPSTMQAMFNKYENADYEYSQEVCNIFCTQRYIYDECGCVDPNQWLAREIRLLDSSELVKANLCYRSNLCLRNASMRFSEDDTLWNKYCSTCKQACKTVDFALTTSHGDSVSTPTLIYTKSFVEQSGVPLPTNWSTDWIEEVKENYIAVDIICRSVIVENFTQSPSYGPVDLLSNVGGQTGLWIGISFLSIMEFIEMLVRIIEHKFLPCFYKFM